MRARAEKDDGKGKGSEIQDLNIWAFGKAQHFRRTRIWDHDDDDDFHGDEDLRCHEQTSISPTTPPRQRERCSIFSSSTSPAFRDMVPARLRHRGEHVRGKILRQVPSLRVMRGIEEATDCHFTCFAAFAITNPSFHKDRSRSLR